MTSQRKYCEYSLSQSKLSHIEDTIIVLHVDDDTQTLSMSKLILEDIDPKLVIETFASPEEAIHALQNQRYDCVVSDYQMPQIDGIELTRRVRKFSDIPFIIYTGRGSEEVAEAAFTVGVDDYLRKELNPSHYQVLARRIRASVEKSWSESRQAFLLEVLNIIGKVKSSEEALDAILGIVKKHTGAEAVGIRLREGDDYPYYVWNGFSEEHIFKENSLCAMDLDGQLLRDEAGNPVLDCMCGNIIQGRFDPSEPFFTEGGSFWTNCTTELLASTTEEDRQGRTRNVCNVEGYESVALIPLRGEDGNLGLLQLNDRRRDMYTLRLIEFLESLGESVGVALARIIIDRELQEAEGRFRGLFYNLDLGVIQIDRDGSSAMINPRGRDIRLLESRGGDP